MPDRAANVTGASRGIGFALADALGEEGYALTVSARKPDTLAQAAEGLRANGYEVEDVAANMADEDAIRAVVARPRDCFGRLDVLVNNAGVGIGAAAADHQTKFVDMQLDVNLRAIVLFYRRAVPDRRCPARSPTSRRSCRSPTPWRSCATGSPTPAQPDCTTSGA